MNREEAMTLLKELVAHDLVEPSHISVHLRTPQHYQIQVRSDYNRQQIQNYVKKNKLCVEEDPAKKFLRIYKP